MMEIARLESSGGHPLTVAAAIVVVGSVQRLVNIAHEVQQKLESNDLFLLVGSRVRQFCGELLNLVDDAIVGGAVRGRGAGRDGRMTEAGHIEVRRCDLNIDEMPLPRFQSRA